MSQVIRLKAIADETRVRILCALSQESLCVCELEAILGLLQSNVSRHLNKLASCGLVTSEKCNKFIYYKLNYNLVDQEMPYLTDMLTLEKLQNDQVKLDLEVLRNYMQDQKSLGEDKLSMICCELKGE